MERQQQIDAVSQRTYKEPSNVFYGLTGTSLALCVTALLPENNAADYIYGSLFGVLAIAFFALPLMIGRHRRKTIENEIIPPQIQSTS